MTMPTARGPRAGRQFRCRCPRHWCACTATTCTEFGDLDSDYVFVNLWADPVGRPLRYQAVAKLVARLRHRTGIQVTPHLLRHARATELIRAGVPIEVVSRLLTHASVATTSETCLHLSVEDVRAELIRSGVWQRSGES